MRWTHLRQAQLQFSHLQTFPRVSLLVSNYCPARSTGRQAGSISTPHWRRWGTCDEPARAPSSGFSVSGTWAKASSCTYAPFPLPNFEGQEPHPVHCPLDDSRCSLDVLIAWMGDGRYRTEVNLQMPTSATLPPPQQWVCPALPRDVAEETCLDARSSNAEPPIWYFAADFQKKVEGGTIWIAAVRQSALRVPKNHLWLCWEL